jgi:L-ascorbate metabolism protein UlaG (beta-lactamase superfamily)
LEIGAYHPSWGDIHLGPDNALTAYGMLGSGALLPIHWGTFNLAVHPWDEPIETVLRRAPSLGIPLVTPKLGEPVEPARAAAPDPWWRSVSAEPAVESAQQPEDESALEWMPD